MTLDFSRRYTECDRFLGFDYFMCHSSYPVFVFSPIPSVCPAGFRLTVCCGVWLLILVLSELPVFAGCGDWLAPGTQTHTLDPRPVLPCDGPECRRKSDFPPPVVPVPTNLQRIDDGVAPCGASPVLMAVRNRWFLVIPDADPLTGFRQTLDRPPALMSPISG